MEARLWAQRLEDLLESCEVKDICKGSNDINKLVIIVLLMVIGCYFRLNYHTLLMAICGAILLMDIGGYLVVILL